MGLIKLLILVALVLAALAFWRRLKRWQASRAGTAPTPGAPEPMVRCAQCNVHLPRNLAVRDQAERWFCCPEHRDERGHG